MKRNSDIFAEIVTGVFMTAVLALLAYFTIVISGVDLLSGRSRVRAKVMFADVGGLKTRDSVMYRGMKVGTVERIDLGATNVTVTIVVDPDVSVRGTGRISVQPLSLLGGNYLLVEEGTGAVRPLESTVFEGDPPVDFMRTLGRIAASFDGVVGGATGGTSGETTGGTPGGGLDGMLSKFGKVADSLDEVVAGVKRIVDRVDRGEGTVGKLLSSDETVYNDLKEAVAGARKAVDDAKSVFASFAVVSERLEKGEGTLGRLLSTNDTIYVDLASTVSNAAAVSARLERGEGTLGRLLSKDDALYGELTKTVLNLRAVSEKLASGKGTLGKLMDESSLHDEIEALVKDLREIVDNYRDTTPISTFGALATGAL